MSYERRNKTMFKICSICDSLFERVYKMTLPNWEKQQFCSQKCNGLNKVGKPMAPHTRHFSEELLTQKREMMLGNQRAKGYKHTEDAKIRMAVARSGEKHWDWKGDNATYSAFHKWLGKNYGPSDRCENKLCPQTSKSYDYALIHGKSHSHKRENYLKLCHSCHMAYDVSNRIRIEL